jgi:SAM-dependent methyltransferase
LEELKSDPLYEEEVLPMLLDLLDPRPGLFYLDLGCGEGRVMAAVRERGALSIGCDLNPMLLIRAQLYGPVVESRLPDLSWVRPATCDGAYLGLVLEHLPDEHPMFLAAARAVRPGGTLAMVINHPIFTAPESSPMEEPDGEVLWRPGRYFDRGWTDEPAGRESVRFYHRTLGELLNAASAAGWDLDRMEEQGVSPAQVARTPDLAGQQHIPRLLGVVWRRRREPPADLKQEMLMVEGSV